MSLATRLSLVVVSILFIGAGTLQAITEPPANQPPQAAASYSPEQRRLVDFALGRFERAGLTVPPVSIEFDGSDSLCFGYGGIYSPREARILICRPSKTTMIHEIAHAWLDANVSPDERRDFLETRGLKAWAGAGAWDEQGAEHAAEILTWALMDEEILVDWIVSDTDGETVYTQRLFKIPESTPERLFAAYSQLTGSLPNDRLAGDLPESTTTTVFSPEMKRIPSGGS